jgi:choice-of-anchor B domain-containing protein
VSRPASICVRCGVDGTYLAERVEPPPPASKVWEEDLTRIQTAPGARTATYLAAMTAITLVASCGDDPLVPGEFGYSLGSTIECQAGSAAGFSCSNIDLVSFLRVENLGGGPVPGANPADSVPDITLNDLWGWTDPQTGIEYALVGRRDGTAFVSLEDPENPVYLGELFRTVGSPVSHWRDVKVYADHAFIVADRASNHGVQIFDLRQLRSVSDPPQVFQETQNYSRIASAHNIVINEVTGFAYVVAASEGGDTCGRGLHMIDVRTPSAPTFAGCFADHSTGREESGYTHDAQCTIYAGPDEEHAGKEICLGANENALSIADVTDKQNPEAISRATYPDFGYVHQGWLSQDHRFFYVNDETDELRGAAQRTRTLVWDIEDLDDPILANEHLGVTTSTDHNLYIRDHLMYQANYRSGLRILDISDPVNPVEVGFFDTVAGANDPGFSGAWSSYPFFQSGIIAFTSRSEGLFVVRMQ